MADEAQTPIDELERRIAELDDLIRKHSRVRSYDMQHPNIARVIDEVKSQVEVRKSSLESVLRKALREEVKLMASQIEARLEGRALGQSYYSWVDTVADQRDLVQLRKDHTQQKELLEWLTKAQETRPTGA